MFIRDSSHNSHHPKRNWISIVSLKGEYIFMLFVINDDNMANTLHLPREITALQLDVDDGNSKDEVAKHSGDEGIYFPHYVSILNR